MQGQPPASDDDRLERREWDSMPEKNRKLTQRQKDSNRKIKKKLQEQGTIPADKENLNRKKFVDDVIAEWRERDYSEKWDSYLSEAAFIVSAKINRSYRISPEAVGAAKVLKMALMIKEFEDRMKAEGREKYSYQEKMNYLWDVFQA